MNGRMPNKLVELIPEYARVCSVNGAVYGLHPAETLFGRTYHAHMIPPFVPDHTLMLGYGCGTVAELMRKVWGKSLKITGVDIERRDWDYCEHRFVKMDAYDFVRECSDGMIKKRFDYIAVDLYNGKEVPSFVYETEFAVRLKEICRKMISFNIPDVEFRKMRSFYDYGFIFDRAVVVDAQCVNWWTVNS